MCAHCHSESLFLKRPVIFGFSADRHGNVRENAFASSVFRLCHWTTRPRSRASRSVRAHLLFSKLGQRRKKLQLEYRRSNRVQTRGDQQKLRANSLESTSAERFAVMFENGARGGNRTHTALRPPDFESGASASSATPGRQFKNNMPPSHTQGRGTPHVPAVEELVMARFIFACRTDAHTS